MTEKDIIDLKDKSTTFCAQEDKSLDLTQGDINGSFDYKKNQSFYSAVDIQENKFDQTDNNRRTSADDFIKAIPEVIDKFKKNITRIETILDTNVFTINTSNKDVNKISLEESINEKNLNLCYSMDNLNKNNENSSNAIMKSQRKLKGMIMHDDFANINNIIKKSVDGVNSSLSSVSKLKIGSASLNSPISRSLNNSFSSAHKANIVRSINQRQGIHIIEEKDEDLFSKNSKIIDKHSPKKLLFSRNSNKAKQYFNKNMSVSNIKTSYNSSINNNIAITETKTKKLSSDFVEKKITEIRKVHKAKTYNKIPIITKKVPLPSKLQSSNDALNKTKFSNNTLLKKENNKFLPKSQFNTNTNTPASSRNLGFTNKYARIPQKSKSSSIVSCTACNHCKSNFHYQINNNKDDPPFFFTDLINLLILMKENLPLIDNNIFNTSVNHMKALDSVNKDYDKSDLDILFENHEEVDQVKLQSIKYIQRAWRKHRLIQIFKSKMDPHILSSNKLTKMYKSKLIESLKTTNTLLKPFLNSLKTSLSLYKDLVKDKKDLSKIISSISDLNKIDEHKPQIHKNDSLFITNYLKLTKKTKK